MSSKITKPMQMTSPEELLRAICAPDVLPDENAESFEYLRKALFGALEPKSPYEQLLAEQMVALEWDAVRYRRLRDNLLKAEFRKLAEGAFAHGRIGAVTYQLSDETYKARAQELVANDSERRQSALTVLAHLAITQSEIMAKAYQQLARDLEVFERQIAETETRRRKLREDYDRVTASRTKAVQ